MDISSVSRREVLRYLGYRGRQNRIGQLQMR